MRILDRYMLGQLILPVLIGLAVFVVIMLSETAIKLGEIVVGARVPAGQIALYLLYSLPRALAWSLPVGVLLGVAMVSTSMTRNGEATATRAGGTSPQRMWRSFFLVGVLGSLASFAVEEYVAPPANQRATETFRQMTHSQPVLRPRDQQAFRDEEGRIIYIGHMDEKANRLDDVMILSEDAQGRLRTMTVAKRAEVSGETWRLREGVSIQFDAYGQPAEDWDHFEAREVRLWSALQDYYLDQRTPFEMSTRELREAAAALEAGGIDAQRMKVRLQFKYSIPVACLVFVLVAAPLGMRFAHHGSFVGIVLSILIVFLYNGVRSWGLAFGLVGELPIVVAGWGQNVIFGALGLWLVLRAK